MGFPAFVRSAWAGPLQKAGKLKKHKKLLSATKEEVESMRLQLPALASQLLIKCHQESLSARTRNELRDEFFWRCDWLLDGEMLDGDNIHTTIPDYQARAGFDFLKLYKKWMLRLKAEFDIFMAKDMSIEQWQEKYGPGPKWPGGTYADKVKHFNEGLVELDRVFREQVCAARFVALSAEQLELHRLAAIVYRDKSLADTSAAMANIAKPRRRSKKVDEVILILENFVWTYKYWPRRNAAANIAQCSEKTVSKCLDEKNGSKLLIAASNPEIPRSKWPRKLHRGVDYVKKHKKIAMQHINNDVARGKITRTDARTTLSAIDKIPDTVDSVGLVEKLAENNNEYIAAQKKHDKSFTWIYGSDKIPSN